MCIRDRTRPSMTAASHGAFGALVWDCRVEDPREIRPLLCRGAADPPGHRRKNVVRAQDTDTNAVAFLDDKRTRLNLVRCTTKALVDAVKADDNDVIERWHVTGRWVERDGSDAGRRRDLAIVDKGVDHVVCLWGDIIRVRLQGRQCRKTNETTIATAETDANRLAGRRKVTHLATDEKWTK